MPIDPSIPLRSQVPPSPSMADMIGGAYQIRAMRDAEEQRQQAKQDAEAVRQALASTGGDIEKALPAITQVAPAVGIGLQEKVLSARKAKTDALKADQELVNARIAHDTKVAELVGRAFVGVRDDNQEDWDNALAELHANGLDNPRIPRQVNNAVRDQYVSRSMEVKDLLSERRAAAEAANKQPKILGEWLGTVGQVLNGVTDQATLDQAREFLKDEGAPESVLKQLPSSYSKDAVDAAGQLGMTAEQRAKLERESRGSDYAQALAREAKRRGLSSVADMPKEDEIKFRREWATADDRVIVTPGGDVDIEAMGDSIIDGKAPPTMTGLYRYAAPLRSYLAKKGFNLAAAEQDWRATSRYMQSLNSTQQLRLRQAVGNAYHSLDTIEAAAKAWEGGNFQDLNKARLALAKRGNIGGSVKAAIPMLNKETGRIEMRTKEWTAAEIAQVLEAQIADVTSELANVYMGGNSPTDHALSLAGENLSADWDKKRLLTLIDQSRTNLKIRENSMNVGPAGVTGTYTPPGAADAAPPVPPQQAAPSTAPQAVVDYMKDKPVGSRTRFRSDNKVYVKTATGVVPE